MAEQPDLDAGKAANQAADAACYTQSQYITTDAQARAFYACKFYAAVEENARINTIIAGIQQASAFYFADKQYDIAKQAQDRLDLDSSSQRDKADKLFNHWYDYAREKEIVQLNKAAEREAKGYQIDYETAKNRVLADVRIEFGRAAEKHRRERKVRCVGASRVALRQLAIAEARAAVAAANGAYRAEENRKDLKEAQYREELYKYLGLFRGVVGDSLNASKAATAAAAASSQINPYSGWTGAMAGLSNLGNAWNTQNIAGAAMQSAGVYGGLFGSLGSVTGSNGIGAGNVPMAWLGTSGGSWVNVPVSQLSPMGFDMP